tara:strand:+ start:512 stop:640 length:129 start_codon:yes stop_codon:yes gene_type:complete
MQVQVCSPGGDMGKAPVGSKGKALGRFKRAKPLIQKCYKDGR